MEPIVVNDLMAKEDWAVDHWVEEDLWSKNRHAAIIHRVRRGRPMCAYCFSRHCHDTVLIYGSKCFKKSKIVNGPKRKLSPNYDTASDDEPAESPQPTEPAESPQPTEPAEPADDRVV